MQKYGDWEPLEPPIGEGGQSTVYLARTPQRMATRGESYIVLRDLAGGGLRNLAVAEQFAKASFELARPDLPSELGALKVFRIREGGGAPAEERLRREIAVLRENRVNLPALLDANIAERWMVTEYFPYGSLDKSPYRYKGQPILALHAFRTVVETIATALHKNRIVHRDIKPANIFIGHDGKLIPGDFGIVFVPNQGDRVTVTDERVGPRDYMPPWADLGDPHEDVPPSFDVYMLGKLLWCMVAGRLRLPHEFHRHPKFDLEKMFPENKDMPLINSILDRCLVRSPDECLPSAEQLLEVIDAKIAFVEHGWPVLDKSGHVILPCHVCGRGYYQQHQAELRIHTVVDAKNMPLSPIHFRIFVCNVCTHYAFFAPGYPDEAAVRNWSPWSSLKT